MKLIGGKKHMGVTFKVTDAKSLMGYAKIWFGGNFIGTSKDLIYLDGYLLGMLEEIRDSGFGDLGTSDKNILFDALYKRLGNVDDLEIHNYLVRGATFTDDFIIFSFRDDGYMLHIVWKLMRKPTFFSDLKNASEEVHYFTVPYIEYAAFVNEVASEIMSG